MYKIGGVVFCLLLSLCISQASVLPQSTADTEAKEKLDFLEINKGVKGLIDGDVLPSKSTRNTIVDQSNHWPSTSIPVSYGVGLSLEAIGSITLARTEYRLRTCLDFIDRTTESNYVNYRTLNGCYSSVGCVGGAQTLSIGSGCERIGTVIHEMMHAIGIWHEQSRTDRDDYVEIMWEDIEAGYENNFNKYDYLRATPRRVPYDYTSVMHYSQSGFSTNGNPTIVTRDPDFQDVIGQRNGFSKGDSEKINRMYQCSDTLLYTYNCNFDDEAVCGYANDYTDDDVDWIPYAVGDNSVTVPASAPSGDSTTGESPDAYLILDTTSQTAGQLAEVRTMRYLTKAPQQCLQFSYYINKDTKSDAAFTVELGTIDELNGDITSYDPLMTLSEDTGGKWAYQRMTITAPAAAYRVVFKGKTAAYEDTFAIDDVNVMDKTCDDGYFVTNDYAVVMADHPKGSSFLSPVMTSTQGYNFRLKVFPQGTSSAADGYMSLYFGLVQGPDDATLDWPFCNKYVRMAVIDQNENPLYAMNRGSEFVTSQSAGGDLWNQPTSSNSAGYYGYRNFMKISDLAGRNNYLNLDRLIISVLIQDMNWVNGEVCSGSFTRSADAPVPVKKSGDIDIPFARALAYEGHDYEHDGHDHHEHNEPNDQYPPPAEYPTSDGKSYMPVGAAIGLTIGVALTVVIAMSVSMYCITKAYKKQVQILQKTVVVRPDTTSPPQYRDETVTFDKLPIPQA